jgi:hypothetical protein
VWLLFLLAALNDLDVLACDIPNAYINAVTKEKIWIRSSDEMGSDKGKVIIIVRALYGLKSSGARWREHMVQTLQNGGFMSCKADPDLWLKPATKPDGFKIYEYVLCYVDDCIYQGLDPPGFMDYLETVHTLKDSTVQEPETYLSTEVQRHKLADGKKAWAISSNTYVQRAVKEVERELARLASS